MELQPRRLGTALRETSSDISAFFRALCLAGSRRHRSELSILPRQSGLGSIERCYQYPHGPEELEVHIHKHVRRDFTASQKCPHPICETIIESADALYDHLVKVHWLQVAPEPPHKARRKRQRLS